MECITKLFVVYILYGAWKCSQRSENPIEQRFRRGQFSGGKQTMLGLGSSTLAGVNNKYLSTRLDYTHTPVEE